MFSKEQVAQVIESNSLRDSAKMLGCVVDTLKREIKRHGLVYTHKGKSYGLRKKMPACFSSLQDEVLTGCLLGDGHLAKDRSRLQLEQKETRFEYSQYLHKTLLPFSASLKTSTRFKKKFEEWQTRCVFVTYKHPLFAEWRTRWYRGRRKVVPLDIVLTPRAVAHWFCQDGSNTNGMIRLHTNSFLERDVELLCCCLKRDLDVASHIIFVNQTQPIIVIGSRDNGSNKTFLETVSSFVPWNCFEYKLHWDKSIRRRTGTSTAA